MSRYRLTPLAVDDLKSISQYIASDQQSPQGEKRLRAMFFDRFRSLARNPFSGATCPEYGDRLRISSLGGYVILYEPRPDGIDIIQVAHGARDLPAIVRQRLSAETSRDQPTA